MQTPLRDAAGEKIGLIVLAYENPDKSGKTDKDFFAAGTKLRDDLEKDIPGFAALFDTRRLQVLTGYEYGPDSHIVLAAADAHAWLCADRGANKKTPAYREGLVHNFFEGDKCKPF